MLFIVYSPLLAFQQFERTAFLCPIQIAQNKKQAHFRFLGEHHDTDEFVKLTLESSEGTSVADEIQSSAQYRVLFWEGFFFPSSSEIPKPLC